MAYDKYKIISVASISSVCEIRVKRYNASEGESTGESRVFTLNASGKTAAQLLIDLDAAITDSITSTAVGDIEDKIGIERPIL